MRKFTLNKDCFSHPTRSRELYVYREEMGFLQMTDEYVSRALDNLDRLFRLSEEKGINLIFLICADKYDSYEPWIEGKHPENHILDPLPKDDRIVVMTPYIRELVAAGVKDVYQINDGHTSTIGAARCAEVVAEAINKTAPGQP